MIDFDSKLRPAGSAILPRCSNYFRSFSRRWQGTSARVATLLVENLLLRYQLRVALRSRPRPHLKAKDRFVWLAIRRLQPGWRQYLILVRPETVVRWHRRGWRLYWRWRSGFHLGRPRLSLEVRDLIATMASENPLWGSERIRGELLKLGIVVSLARYVATAGLARRDRPARAGAPSLRIMLRRSGRPTSWLFRP